MDSFIALGRLHVPVYALVAAAGLMCSLALGLRTAGLAGIDPDAFWDLGVVSVLAAFVLSRVTLVLEDLTAIRQFPAAILELPWLSASGAPATIIVIFWYLRRRRLPLLGVLDAAAPCGALLWSFFALAEFAAGTREGMPTSVAWAIPSSFGRVHPVELYTMLAWLAAGAATYRILRRQGRPGETGFCGLILAGLVFALTDFFRLPNQLYGNQVLDGIQWRGLELIVLGGVLLAWREAVPPRAAPQPRRTAADAF